MHLDPMIGSGQGMEIKASIRDSGRTLLSYSGKYALDSDAWL